MFLYYKVIIKVAELFNQNPYSLTVGTLSPDYFSVLGFYSEPISFNHDYVCVVHFRLRKKISLQNYLHQTVRLDWQGNSISGVISTISQENIVISSPLYLLNLTKHSRVYADRDVEKLIRAVLENNNWIYKLDFKFLLKSNYPISGYTAQYLETDLEFIQRQCSRWGIFFSFIQQKTHKPILVFCDNSLIFTQQFPEAHISPEKFSQYKLYRKVLARSVKINDYNPNTPNIDLSMEIQSRSKSVGIDNRPYEFYQTREWGEIILKRRLEYYDCHREIILAEIGNINLQLGQGINTQDKFFDFLYISQIKFAVDILNNTKYISLGLIDAQRTYRPELPKLFHMPDCTGRIISDKVDHAGRYYISPDYDERHEDNTYPVRLLQPCTGENLGFHFPLIKNTKIVITHINGDPDRPVIVGAIPGEERPNTVTAENSTQHILKTPMGNQWLMDDDETQARLKFSIAGNKALLNLGSDHISLEANQNSNFKAGKLISHKTAGNYTQIIGRDYNIIAGNNYKIYTQNNSNLSSGKDLVLMSHQARLDANKIINISAEEKLHISARDINFKSSQMNIISKNNIALGGKIINLKSNHKIILSVGSSSLVISSMGITVNATSVNFNTASFTSPPPQLGSSPSQTATSSFNLNKFCLNYINLENSLAAYTLSRANEIIYSGNIREINHINNIDISENITVQHSGLAVISVDDKSQKPADNYIFKPVLNKSHQIKLLKKPVYKKITKLNNAFQCELLDKLELNYFKNNNNIILFVHGYDIQEGHFGEYSYIRTAAEGFPDDSVNGTGAPNWLLHMEYNLNCAVFNRYLEFPWDSQALQYKRILGIHWPGYQRIFDIPYSDDLNFAGMEFNAIETGYALIALIKQLKSSGLDIYIIAHSLGCLAVIQLMDLLGREGKCEIEKIFFWEPAIAATALSPKIIDSVEQRRRAVSQTVAGEAGSLALPPLMLYEYYGEFLRQKAAKFKHIPPWDVYEKDPFAYFPYAHRAAKKIHVLFSHYDDTLKYAYQLNSVFAGLPHVNFIHHPMGLQGPDEETLKLLGSQLIHTDQKNWLLGHSEMKIPTKLLFENIYLLIMKEIGSL